MLFTRCPDCDTTFRVTDDALKKANGQVRCGRCASVFNAYAEQRDPPSEAFSAHPDENPVSENAEPTPAPATTHSTTTAPLTDAPPESPHSAAIDAEAAPASVPAPAAGTAALTAAGGAAPANAEVAHAPRTPVPSRDETAREILRPVPRAPVEETFDSMSVADVVAQVEIGVADENAGSAAIDELAIDSDAEDISPSEVQQVLEGEADGTGSWPLDAPETRPRTRLWATCAVLALIVLAVQSVHHYRTELVANPTIGPVVASTYALLGERIAPRWDIRQYEILDWIATAEPSGGGQGSLRITARIKNRGPLDQPYPSVHLRLKDRWDEAVGSRVFAPTEYLAAEPRKLMAPGETTRAEIDVVDPGQDAYGFELDVCIEIETHVLSCGNDKVFL